jgi:uncharacterized protein
LRRKGEKVTTGYKVSCYHVVTQPLADGREGGRLRRILFAARTASPFVLDEALWTEIREGRIERLPDEVRNELIRSEFLVPEEENELLTILEDNDRDVRGDRRLYVVVQPSGWCQLGCPYCGQAHVRQTLSPENQDRLVQRVRTVLEGGRYDRLDICWFGAEPLLAMDVVRSLTARFRQITDELGYQYVAKMVTNGLALTPRLAAEVVRDLAIDRIEITLDGSAEYHDRRRCTKTGGPTFDAIFRNVVDLASREDLKVILTLRCNVDQHNRAGVVPLMLKLVEAGIHQRIANFYVAPVSNWGNDAGDRNVSREEFALWEAEWLAQMFHLGLPLAVVPQREKGGCIAVRDDAEVVDPYGTLFKCGETPLVPSGECPPESPQGSAHACMGCGGGSATRYAVGDLAHGADPRLFVFAGFNDRIRRRQYDCHACSLFPVCGGYCPKKWHEGVVPCPAFKYNIQQRLLTAFAIGRVSEVDKPQGLGIRD